MTSVAPHDTQARHDDEPAPTHSPAQTLSAYARDLAGVVSATQVTDRQGCAMRPDDGATRAVEMLAAARRSGNKVMLVGNGGSAAIVSHMQNDLCKADGVRAMVFTEQPLLTALSNDMAYAAAFEYAVNMWASPGDVLVALSSSGQSSNILRAAAAARASGCAVIGFSGFRPDNPLRSLGDLNFYCASSVYGYVETAHAALTHYLTDRLVQVQEGGRP